MDTKETISKEVTSLYAEGAKILQAFTDKDKEQSFQFEYQKWYTQAIRIVTVLAPDRQAEFKSYYEIDPKRKSLGYGTYVIQDYLRGASPNKFNYPDFDARNQVSQCFFNQLSIFHSLSDRAGSILGNIDGQLLSDIQDAELETAQKLLKISVRAAGALAGVIIENHLQKVAKNHSITIRKKNPTIADLNEPLKKASILDTPTWRKITYLADIRNICSHKKNIEPTKEQVTELIDGTNWLIKNIF